MKNFLFSILFLVFSSSAYALDQVPKDGRNEEKAFDSNAKISALDTELKIQKAILDGVDKRGQDFGNHLSLLGTQISDANAKNSDRINALLNIITLLATLGGLAWALASYVAYKMNSKEAETIASKEIKEFLTRYEQEFAKQFQILQSTFQDELSKQQEENLATLNSALASTLEKLDIIEDDLTKKFLKVQQSIQEMHSQVNSESEKVKDKFRRLNEYADQQMSKVSDEAGFRHSSVGSEEGGVMEDSSLFELAESAENAASHGDFNSALGKVDIALSLAKNQNQNSIVISDFVFFKSLMLVKLNKFDDAIFLLEEAISKFEAEKVMQVRMNILKCRFVLASIFDQKNNREQATKIFSDIIKEYGNDNDLHVQLQVLNAKLSLAVLSGEIGDTASELKFYDEILIQLRDIKLKTHSLTEDDLGNIQQLQHKAIHNSEVARRLIA